MEVIVRHVLQQTVLIVRPVKLFAKNVQQALLLKTQGLIAFLVNLFALLVLHQLLVLHVKQAILQMLVIVILVLPT